MRISYERILCAIDFSDYTPVVLSYAMAIAKNFNSRLMVCHIVDLRSTAMYGEAAVDLMEQRNQVIDYIKAQMSDLFGEHSMHYDPLIAFGRPAYKIAQISVEKKVDLVITATRGRSGIKRIVLGSVTEKLMRTLHCPLLVINSTKHSPVTDTDLSFFKGFKKILIGCDFSEQAEKALLHGVDISNQFKAKAVLAHVYAASDPMTSKTNIDPGDYSLHMEDQMRIWALKSLEEPLSFQFSVIEGGSDTALTQYAEKNDCDLIIIAATGSSVLKSLLIGSTASRVVRESPCPVLLIRYSDKRKKSGYDIYSDAEASEKNSCDDELSFFSIRYKEQSAILHFKDNLLFHASDLAERDNLFEQLDRIEKDSDVKTLIILGAPDKTGLDEYVDFFSLVLESKLESNALHRLLNSIDQFILRMLSFNKLVIHADIGKVLSIFLNLSLACDFRIITDDTLFQCPYLELGMIPKGGGAYFLSKMLGTPKALKILTTKTEISAQEALDLGLVDLVVPADQLEEAALSFARQFYMRSIRTMTGIKKLVQFSYSDIRKYLELENEEILKIIGSPIRDSAFWRNIRGYKQENQ